MPGYRFIGNFLVLNLEYPDGKYPEDILRDIFAIVIKQLETGAQEMGLNANHFLFQFDSSIMDHSVPLYLHELNPNSVEVLLMLFVEYFQVLLHKFRAIDQSGEQRGKDSLVTQEFLIDASAFESKPPPANANQRKKNMNKPNPTISLDELKQLVHSNRDELDQTIEEAISYLDTLHHTSHILFHIVHAFLLYVTDKEIREDLEHI